MSISIRLDKTTEAELRNCTYQTGIAMSDFVRDAIREKLATYNGKLSPFEAGKDLFGKYSSGAENLSTDRKTRLKQKIRAKHRH